MKDKWSQVWPAALATVGGAALAWLVHAQGWTIGGPAFGGVGLLGLGGLIAYAAGKASLPRHPQGGRRAMELVVVGNLATRLALSGLGIFLVAAVVDWSSNKTIQATVTAGAGGLIAAVNGLIAGPLTAAGSIWGAFQDKFGQDQRLSQAVRDRLTNPNQAPNWATRQQRKQRASAIAQDLDAVVAP